LKRRCVEETVNNSGRFEDPTVLGLRHIEKAVAEIILARENGALIGS
jgi:hypothetical protein